MSNSEPQGELPNEGEGRNAQGELNEAGKVGRGYYGSDGAVCCAECDCECEWEQCYAGCEDGYFDSYEEDPLWYQPGDLVPCTECLGQGGHYWCVNSHCGTNEIIKITPVKPKQPAGKDVNVGD